jgi:mono/diheme cytochrome c family protein
MTTSSAALFSILLSTAILGGNANAQPAGKAAYLADCARCHGVDGKGAVPEMSAVPGYISVDLTQLSKSNDGRFPRQRVYNTIDGRQRFPAHLIGDMPVWGLKYGQTNLAPDKEKLVKRRISALVDYIESIQEK